jgi:mannosyltransferase
VAAATCLAALLRFPALGHQSFWSDEATTGFLVHGSFGDMLAGVHDHETPPPLYFAGAWLWARVFGEGEAALRSFSAVCGTLTVPVAYADRRG